MNSSKSNNFALSIASLIFIVLVAIGVFYVFSKHIVIVNVCSDNKTLIVLDSGPSCFPGVSGVIAGGVPYFINSSTVASSVQLTPLSFRFIGDDPLLYIWNQNMSVSARQYDFLTIPDTFKVHMQYTSSIPTEFMIMNSTEFARFETGKVYSYINSTTGASISLWFNESAGCAGYVAVIKSVSGAAFIIQPNETALYAPASEATGVCA